MSEGINAVYSFWLLTHCLLIQETMAVRGSRPLQALV